MIKAYKLGYLVLPNRVKMDRRELEKYLPHRQDMLLLDTCVKTDDGQANATYQVRGDEFFLRGHFPDKPIVPGVILCEIMAQSCCVLILGNNEQPIVRPLAYFTGIKEAKFKGVVQPGDLLEVSTQFIRKVSNFYFAKGHITVRGNVVCTAEFSFAVVKES